MDRWTETLLNLPEGEAQKQPATNTADPWVAKLQSIGQLAAPESFQTSPPIEEYIPPRMRGQLTQEEHQQILGDEDPGFLDWIANIVTAPARGALSDVAGTSLKGISVNAGNLAPLTGDYTPAEEGGFYGLGQGIQDVVSDLIPGDPRLEGSFLGETVPRAVGQAGAYIGATAATGSPATPAVLGALQSSGSIYDEAKSFGADEATAQLVSAFGIPLGATEAFGVSNAKKWLGLLGKANKTTKGAATRSILEMIKRGEATTFLDAAKHILGGAAEETIQEVGQTVGENIVAKASYDPKRPVMQGTLEAGGSAALVGGAGSGIQQFAAKRQSVKNIQQARAEAPQAAPTPVSRGTSFTKAELLTPAGAKQYATTNAEAAGKLVEAASKGTVSRQAFQKSTSLQLGKDESAGQLDLSGAERLQFANLLKEELANATKAQEGIEVAGAAEDISEEDRKVVGGRGPDTQAALSQGQQQATQKGISNVEVQSPSEQTQQADGGEEAKVEGETKEAEQAKAGVLEPSAPPIPPEDAKYTPPEGGKPKKKLANISTDPNVRSAVESVDKLREEAGRPEHRPRSAAETEATARLKKDYEGERNRLIDSVARRTGFNEADIVSASKIVEKEWKAALSSADETRLTDAILITDSYREAKGEVSRALSLRDPLGELRRAILEPPDWISRKIRAAFEGKSFKDKPSTYKEPVASSPTVKARASKARAEFKKSLDDFGKYLSGKQFSTPLDPELFKRTVDLAYKGAKAAGLSFADFVKDLTKSIGQDRVRKLEPAIREGWEKARKENPRIGAATSIDEALNKPQKGGDETKLKEARKAAAEWANKLRKVQKLLADIGIDINDLEAVKDDPVKIAKIKNIATASKSTFFEKLMEYRRNWGLMSSLTTVSRNITGNFLNPLMSIAIEHPIEAAVNVVGRRKESAQLGELNPAIIFKGSYNGIVNGVRNAIMSWKTEQPWLEQSLGREEGTDSFDNSRVAIEGELGKKVRWPQRVNAFVDEIAKSIIGHIVAGQRAYRIARAEGLSGDEMIRRIDGLVNDGTSEAWDQAIEEAQILTYQKTQTKIGTKAAEIAIDARRKAPVLGLVAPFIRTPIAIAENLAIRTPLGTFTALPVEIKRAWASGDWSKVTTRVAQQVVAWATLALFWDEDDPTEKFAITGKKHKENPYSMRLGDQWYRYAGIEPIATALGMITDLRDAIKSGDTSKIVGAPYESAMAQLTEKTFLSGLADIVEAMQQEGGWNKAVKLASNIGVSFWPNLFRSTARNVGEHIPERRIWGQGDEWYARMGRRFLQSTELPQLFGKLPDSPKHDWLGRTIDRSHNPILDGAASNFFWRLISPVDVKKDKSIEASVTLANWDNQHPDEAVQKRKMWAPNYYYEENGKTKYMTDEQYKNHTKYSGQITKAVLDDVNLHSEKPTHADIELIKRVVEESRSASKKAVLAGKQVDPVQVSGEIKESIVYSLFKTATSKPSPKDDAKEKEDRAEAAEMLSRFGNRTIIKGIVRQERREKKEDNSSEAFKERLRRLH